MKQAVDVAPKQPGQYTTFGEFTVEQMTQLVSELEAGLSELPLLERLAKRYYLRGISNRLLRGTGSPNPKCVALHSHLRLFPIGDVPTCQFNTKLAGNLRHQTFKDVWSGAQAHEQRE